ISRKTLGVDEAALSQCTLERHASSYPTLQARRAVHPTPTWGSVRAKSLCRKYFIFRNWRAEPFRQAQVPEPVEGLCNAANVNPPPTAGSRSAPLQVGCVGGGIVVRRKWLLGVLP